MIISPSEINAFSDMTKRDDDKIELGLSWYVCICYRALLLWKSQENDQDYFYGLFY